MWNRIILVFSIKLLYTIIIIYTPSL